MHTAPSDTCRLVEAGSYHASRGKDYPRHEHPFWEVLCFDEGQIELTTPEQSCTVDPGTVLTIPPHTPHFERACTAYRDYYIQLEAPPGMPWPFLCHDTLARAFGHLCAALAREWQGDAPDRDEMLALMVRQLDIQLRRSAGRRRPSAAEQLVARAEMLLEKGADQPVRIRDLAGQLAVSVSALRLHFHRVRPYGPLEFLHRVRAQRARALLLDTNLKLEAVAAHCGYHSASHLSRHVRRAFGKAPGALRREAR